MRSTMRSSTRSGTAAHHVGVDIARRDGVDGDALGRALLGERLGEAVDADLAAA